uniref:Envelope glycoprotein n=1 Tax=Salvator merianae TaxID=96440 RepID=A0A8D0BIE7_SALMN
MYGYRTPIYMLNRIIRLQTVLEIVTNETALALNILVRQNTKLLTAVYQNRLALDWLLAIEGGVCGKFNLSDCCLLLDEVGIVIQDITDRMVKTAHVPVQTWKPLIELPTMNGWFSWLGGLEGMAGAICALLLLCILLPCIIPLILHVLCNMVVQITDNRNAASMMILQSYTPICQDDIVDNTDIDDVD